MSNKETIPVWFALVMVIAWTSAFVAVIAIANV